MLLISMDECKKFYFLNIAEQLGGEVENPPFDLDYGGLKPVVTLPNLHHLRQRRSGNFPLCSLPARLI